MPRGPKASKPAFTLVDPRHVVVGIDPSATGTGLAAVDLDGELVSTLQMSEDETGVRRLCHIRSQLASWLGPLRIVHVVMEGYGFHIQNSQSHKLGEVGGAIKLQLFESLHSPACYPSTPATSQVKKYCLGSGKGSKAEMLKGVYKKWHIDVKTDDEAEAYVMARIGLDLVRGGSEVKYEQDVLTAMAKSGLIWTEMSDIERYELGSPAEFWARKQRIA